MMLGPDLIVKVSISVFKSTSDKRYNEQLESKKSLNAVDTSEQ